MSSSYDKNIDFTPVNGNAPLAQPQPTVYYSNQPYPNQQIGFNYNSTYSQPISKANDYLIWSIINIILCSLLFGCIGLYFSIKTRDMNKYGRGHEALSYSKKAKIFNIIATVAGIGLLVLYIVLISIYIPIYIATLYRV